MVTSAIPAGNYSTDFERQYRQEFEHMVAAGYFNREAIFDSNDEERYVWEKGRLYQSGYPIVDWQLDQTMHAARKNRNEKCFEHCRVCRKTGQQTVQQNQKRMILGDPDPREAKGEYPCPDAKCQETFSYLSHLMRHQEQQHNITHDWDAFKEYLEEQSPSQKCVYRGKGRYGKPCGKEALEGELHCGDPEHAEQIRKKKARGEL